MCKKLRGMLKFKEDFEMSKFQYTQGVFLVLSKVILFKQRLSLPKMMKGGSHF